MEPAMLPAPSLYQTGIINAFNTTRDNLLIQACAGSGKTTTLAQLSKHLQFMQTAVALCFNKEIAEQFKKKLPKEVKSCTMHSLGYSICRDTGRRLKVDPYKTENIIRGIVRSKGYRKEDQSTIETDAKWVLDMAYATMTDLADVEAAFGMVSSFDGDLSMPEIAIEVALATREMSRAQQDVIGFNDMLDFPLHFKYKAPIFNVVMIDETQDLSLQQIEFVKLISNKESRIVAVGDRYQAIYAWRGANSGSMDLVKNAFNCREMPLSICYRCPTSVVENARQITNTIEPAPNAIAGVVLHRDARDYDALIPTLQPGTMVVCRTNAPLMPMAMSLIRLGKKAVIRGRDIGGGLVTLIDRLEAKIRKDQPQLLTVTRENFMPALEADARKRARKLVLSDKMKQAQFVIDQLETIQAAFNGITSVPELKDVITRIFTDDISGVILSSVHRAKGLEAPHVVILGPELMPHPMASTDEAIRQEENLRYVAITRAMETLTYQPIPRKSISSSKDAIMAFIGAVGSDTPMTQSDAYLKAEHALLPPDAAVGKSSFLDQMIHEANLNNPDQN